MHPRLRGEAGEAVEVAADVHARAFLEHHKHASVIVSFLVERFGLQNPSYVRPFRLLSFHGSMAPFVIRSTKELILCFVAVKVFLHKS